MRVPTRIHASELAVALDGSIFLSAVHLTTERDLVGLLRRAMAEGGELFIGIQLTRAETRRALAMLNDRAAEIAAIVAGRRQRRRRATDRKSKRSGS